MLVHFLAVCGARSLPPVPEAGIHTYVRLTSRELVQTWQRRTLNNEPLVRNLSVLDKKAINWLRCNRWVRLIDADKNLGTALVESQWIEDQVQIWLNKMTRHITEAEASQKIIAGAQTLGVITDRALESSVIEDKQKSFLLVNSSGTSAPSFRILAKIHKQPNTPAYPSDGRSGYCAPPASGQHPGNQHGKTTEERREGGSKPQKDKPDAPLPRELEGDARGLEKQTGKGWVRRRHSGLLALWPSGCGTGSCLLRHGTSR